MTNLQPRALSTTLLAVCAALACACSAGDPAGRGGSTGGSGGLDGASGATDTDATFDTPRGGGGGTSVVPTAGGAGTAAPTVEAQTIDDCGADNPAGLADADVQTLRAGGAGSGMRFLYPYDGTVFPRGLISPLVMWEGSDAASAVYLHVKSATFEYHGCLVPSAPGQVQIPQDVWDVAEAQTGGPGDPFTLSLTALDGGAAKGPITEMVVIAQATLEGAIFYNSYASQLALNMGAVLRIQPGGNAELFAGGVTPGCNGCHSLSANGERLVTTQVSGGGNIVYQIEPTTPLNPPPLRNNAMASFVGLSPDGSVYMTTAAPLGGPTVRVGTTPASMLIETDTGLEVPGSGIPTGALMGTFSPDGTMIVFNDNAINVSKGLAAMDYDAATRKASNYRKVYESTDDKLPSWPFVLPDNRAVIFQRGTTTDFSGGNVGIISIAGLDPFLGAFLTGIIPSVGPYGNLFITDLETGTTTLLAKAMGYATPADAATKNTYLPFGAADVDQAYYPTVSPVAAGGYFWVFFDSMRNYGNRGLHRQLWGTAVKISPDGKYTGDPSHPAFFLTGQEEGTGNHRAFTALDPCRADGESCETGVDCCGGFCTDGLCGTPEVPRCSEAGESCEAASDCCSPVAACINGFCAEILVE